jgi:hypothetical protein
MKNLDPETKMHLIVSEIADLYFKNKKKYKRTFSAK